MRGRPGANPDLAAGSGAANGNPGARSSGPGRGPGYNGPRRDTDASAARVRRLLLPRLLLRSPRGPRRRRSPRSKASTPRGYFSGKTVKIIVGFSPGGGYDAYSRLVAKAVERLMPGNPKVVVSNLPGGGALRALQETMRARPDGFTTHPMANRHPAAEAAGADLDDFDINTVNMIGTPNFIQTHAALCVRREVAENWDDVLNLGRPITFGTSALGGNAIGGQFAEALGAPVKVVLGYEGTADVQAAIDRNELDATDRCDVFFIDPFFPEWYEQQKLMPLFYWRTPISQSFLDKMNTGLRSEDVPHLFDLVDASEQQQNAFLLAQNLESMTRMFVLPPGTPEEIVLTWQRVFREITEDADFIASASSALARNQLRRPIHPAGKHPEGPGLQPGGACPVRHPLRRRVGRTKEPQQGEGGLAGPPSLVAAGPRVPAY